MSQKLGGGAEEWEPRQFLQKKGYTPLELDALEKRGTLPSCIN
jgi:hypothetical protein